MASEPPPPAALVITGPTASGKTALAVQVARRLGGEVISVDSRQVYRGMDIGTAKVTDAERAGVPHHGLDLVDPGTRYSAGRFARDARRWIREIGERGRVPVLAGGTGFFLRALTHPLFREPPMDADRRRRLGAFLDSLHEDRLREWLAAIDPGAARRLREAGGRQRVSRALEVAVLTGRTLAWWHEHGAPEAASLDAQVFVIHLPREALDRRIDHRVDAMMEAGLVEEVRGLLAQGHGPGAPGMSATGYAEVAEYLAGTIDLDEAGDRIRRATRRYARRQLTWLRNQLGPGAIPLDGTRTLDELTQEVALRWQTRA